MSAEMKPLLQDNHRYKEVAYSETVNNYSPQKKHTLIESPADRYVSAEELEYRFKMCWQFIQSKTQSI